MNAVNFEERIKKISGVFRNGGRLHLLRTSLHIVSLNRQYQILFRHHMICFVLRIGQKKQIADLFLDFQQLAL